MIRFGYSSFRLLDPSYIAASPQLSQQSLGLTALTGQLPGQQQGMAMGENEDPQQRFQSDISRASIKPDSGSGTLQMSPNNAQSYKNKMPQQGM